MSKHSIKRFYLTMTVALMLSWVLSGCGKDTALEEYKESMETYYDQVAEIDAGINSIDPQSDIDGAQLLGYLDRLDTITSDMAQLQVPEQFQIVESLAIEASDNMSKSVILYHQLYDSPEYNEDVASGAYEYYERANLRIRYIREILHGEMPEDLVVVNEDDTGTTEGEE
ncbi:MAG: hypothetical protein K5673_01880 [Lachnospiraceae bacterium]|nr:hypothetical protein [Lachnospiraceae bacterium]